MDTIDDLRASGFYVESTRARWGDQLGPRIWVIRGAGPLSRASRRQLHAAGFRWNRSRKWWQRD